MKPVMQSNAAQKRRMYAEVRRKLHSEREALEDEELQAQNAAETSEDGLQGESGAGTIAKKVNRFKKVASMITKANKDTRKVTEVCQAISVQTEATKLTGKRLVEETGVAVNLRKAVVAVARSEESIQAKIARLEKEKANSKEKGAADKFFELAETVNLEEQLKSARKKLSVGGIGNMLSEVQTELNALRTLLEKFEMSPSTTEEEKEPVRMLNEAMDDIGSAMDSLLFQRYIHKLKKKVGQTRNGLEERKKRGISDDDMSRRRKVSIKRMSVARPDGDGRTIAFGRHVSKHNLADGGQDFFGTHVSDQWTGHKGGGGFGSRGTQPGMDLDEGASGWMFHAKVAPKHQHIAMLKKKPEKISRIVTDAFRQAYDRQQDQHFRGMETINYGSRTRGMETINYGLRSMEFSMTRTFSELGLSTQSIQDAIEESLPGLQLSTVFLSNIKSTEDLIQYVTEEVEDQSSDLTTEDAIRHAVSRAFVNVFAAEGLTCDFSQPISQMGLTWEMTEAIRERIVDAFEGLELPSTFLSDFSTLEDLVEHIRKKVEPPELDHAVQDISAMLEVIFQDIAGAALADIDVANASFLEMRLKKKTRRKIKAELEMVFEGLELEDDFPSEFESLRDLSEYIYSLTQDANMDDTEDNTEASSQKTARGPKNRAAKKQWEEEEKLIAEFFGIIGHGVDSELTDAEILEQHEKARKNKEASQPVAGSPRKKDAAKKEKDSEVPDEDFSFEPMAIGLLPVIDKLTLRHDPNSSSWKTLLPSSSGMLNLAPTAPPGLPTSPRRRGPIVNAKPNVLECVIRNRHLRGWRVPMVSEDIEETFMSNFNTPEEPKCYCSKCMRARYSSKTTELLSKSLTDFLM